MKDINILGFFLNILGFFNGIADKFKDLLGWFVNDPKEQENRIQEAVDILRPYKEYFVMQDALNYVCRLIGWGIIRLLSILLDGLESILKTMYSITDIFLKSDQVAGFFSSYGIVMVGLFTVGVAVLGFLFILQRIQDKARVVTNVLISLIVLIGLPTAMNLLSNVTSLGVDAMSNDGSLSQEIIKTNVTDMLYLANEGFPVEDGQPAFETGAGQKNNIPQDKIQDITIQMLMIPDYLPEDLGDKYRSLFDVHLVTDINGEDTIALNDISVTQFPKQYYYRYHVRFFTIIATQIITIITVFFLCIKVARIQFELLVNRMLASAFAATDLASGQRLKQVLQSIISSFCVMVICSAMLNLYIMVMGVLRDNFSGVGFVLAFAGVSLAVIDGPNLVERVFGIDPGLQSVFKTMVVGRWAMHQVHKVRNTASQIGKSFNRFNSKQPVMAGGGSGGLGKNPVHSSMVNTEGVSNKSYKNANSNSTMYNSNPMSGSVMNSRNSRTNASVNSISNNAYANANSFASHNNGNAGTATNMHGNGSGRRSVDHNRIYSNTTNYNQEVKPKMDVTQNKNISNVSRNYDTNIRRYQLDSNGYLNRRDRK